MDPTGEDLTPQLEGRTDQVLQGGTTPGVPQDHQRSQQGAGQQQPHHQELPLRSQQRQRHEDVEAGTASARPPADALFGDADLDGIGDSERITQEDALEFFLRQQDFCRRPLDLVPCGGTPGEHKTGRWYELSAPIVQQLERL